MNDFFSTSDMIRADLLHITNPGLDYKFYKLLNPSYHSSSVFEEIFGVDLLGVDLMREQCIPKSNNTVKKETKEQDDE